MICDEVSFRKYTVSSFSSIVLQIKRVTIIGFLKVVLVLDYCWLGYGGFCYEKFYVCLVFGLVLFFKFQLAQHSVGTLVVRL